MNKKVFLLADGETLPKNQRDHLKKGRFCLVLDGAAELAKKERWLPDLILGDFDTVKPATLAYFAKKKVTLLHAPCQDQTDLEKALSWCVDQGVSDIWVAQALGKRLDHSLANLSFLKRFSCPSRKILFFTRTEKVQFAKDESLTLSGASGRGFALIPFPKSTISSRGLVYELDALPLELGVHESVSNQAKKNKVEIEVRGSCLVIEERTN